MSRLFNRSNKSQASLDRIADSTAPAQVQQTQGPNQSDTAYSTSQYGGAAHHSAHPSLQQQYHPQQQSLQPSYQHPDEAFYDDQPYQPSASQVLARSQSHRGPPNAANPYQEQQTINTVRPTVNIVAPDNNPRDDDRHQPGKTQFGASRTQHIAEPKDSGKKSKTSRLFGLVSGGKDKDKDKGSPPDRNRLSRTGSVLKRGQQSHPTSPQFTTDQPTSPAQASSQSIASHLRDLDSNENLPDDRDNHPQYEDYYRGGRHQQRTSQYNSPQDPTPPKVQYQEDAPHFPPPPQPGTQQPPRFVDQRQQPQSQPQPQPQPQPQQQQQQPQPYQVQDTEEPEHQFFPYPGQPARSDRPSAILLEEHQSLRPPSQSSLGPPSPLAGPTSQLSSRPATSSTQRYSTQTTQTYHQQAQEAPQVYEGQAHSELEAVHDDPTPSYESPQEQEMPDRSQRKSRLPEEQQDPRYTQAQDPRLRMSAQQEQGRSTPPPRSKDDIRDLDHTQLLLRYDELTAKYSKVKRYYFEREAQITQLQNTVANQRLSMSKTSLDDAQYATRFERLNGTIQNLAFNIRKDWRRVPNWLQPACNRDACQVGTKEMTAVGRACISRWLYEHIFQEIFHPGIDPRLSSQLKQVERALRHTSVLLTDDQRDDLLTKVTTWRLTTCEGLHNVINSRESEANTDRLAHYLAQQLYENLAQFLAEPQPGLDDNLLTIVTQALSIASNLPLESRDVCIEYFFPGTPFSDTYMKIEPAMTPLVNPGSAPTAEDFHPGDDSPGANDDASPASNTPENQGPNVEDQIREAVKSGTTTARSDIISAQTTIARSNSSTLKSTDTHKKKSSGGMFSSFGGGLVGVNKSSSRSQPSQASGTKGNPSGDLSSKDPTGKDSKDDDDAANHAWNIDSLTRGHKADKIRFAVFLAVEVRGKAAKADGESQNGSGNAANEKGAISAGTGQTPASAGNGGGTSGGAGTGGVNVLCKAPVYGF